MAGQSRNITVSTTAVMNAGQKIESDYASDYKNAYEEMFAKMEALYGTWNGTDFSEYSKKVESFKNDFIAMYQVLVEYGEYLQKAAKAYETTQQAVIDDAKTLKM